MIDQEFEDFLATLPAAVAEVARRFPNDTCYRLVGDAGGHYCITSYSEPLNGAPVTLCLEHLPDSRLPGIEVFGVRPESLAACKCGRQSE